MNSEITFWKDTAWVRSVSKDRNHSSTDPAIPKDDDEDDECIFLHTLHNYNVTPFTVKHSSYKTAITGEPAI